MIAPGDSNAALEVRGLGFVFDGGQRALDAIEFTLGSGESLGIIGPNGAGKTTLFLTLMGIYAPSEGEIRVFGDRVPAMNGTLAPVSLRRRIGLVFQESEEQLFSPTVFDDVAFGPLNFGFPREEIGRRVSRALEAVDLPGYENRTPQHLSAGEKRRVAIATVISYGPDIVILDEPTSDLDPRGRRKLAELLVSMPQAKLIASHDLEFVRRTCDRVLLLDHGRIRASGPTEGILGNDELLERHGL